MSDNKIKAARRRCCRHDHGKSSGAAPAARPKSSRSLSSSVWSSAAANGIVANPGQSFVKRPPNASVKGKKHTTSRKRGASPECGKHHHGFLEQLVATETATSGRDATSPTNLNIGGLSLADEKGDANSALFVRRKSPRHHDAVTPATLKPRGRPKTASPNRSSSGSPKRHGRRGKSPSTSPIRAVSASGKRTGTHGKGSRLEESTARDGRQSVPWSITEMLENERLEPTDFGDDDFMTPDDITMTTGSQEGEEEEEEEEEKEERILKDPIGDMMAGPAVNDDEYDTDLEEQFPLKPRVPRDATGRQVYVEKCKEEGIDPASYVLRHLTDPTFQLRHRYLNLQNVVPLTTAMKNNSMIEMLDLCDNHLEDDSGVAIANMLENNVNIIKADLSNNLIRGKGIVAFSVMLESNYTLKTLCLRANHLTDKHAIPLAEALKSNATLTELDLSYNELGEMAGVHLGSGLTVNDGLNFLDLRWNAVRNKGFAAIANALKVNTSLEVLDLSYNGVSVPGCVALMRALKVNTGLRILDLSYNHINNLAAQKLSLGVKKNTRLEALLLASNPIGDDGMIAISKAVKLNPAIKLLSIQNIPMPLIIHQKFRDVQESKDIHVLKLDVDGHKRNTAPSHVAAMVDKFISENQARILNHCLAQDVDHTGVLSVSQVTKALWDSGLDVDKEQLDTALRQTKVIHLKNVPYRPMLDGLSALKMISWKAPSPRVL